MRSMSSRPSMWPQTSINGPANSGPTALSARSTRTFAAITVSAISTPVPGAARRVPASPGTPVQTDVTRGVMRARQRSPARRSPAASCSALIIGWPSLSRRLCSQASEPTASRADAARVSRDRSTVFFTRCAPPFGGGRATARAAAPDARAARTMAAPARVIFQPQPSLAASIQPRFAAATRSPAGKAPTGAAPGACPGHTVATGSSALSVTVRTAPGRAKAERSGRHCWRILSSAGSFATRIFNALHMALLVRMVRTCAVHRG